jgi:hypothetical protein
MPPGGDHVPGKGVGIRITTLRPRVAGTIEGPRERRTHVGASAPHNDPLAAVVRLAYFANRVAADRERSR